MPISRRPFSAFPATVALLSVCALASAAEHIADPHLNFSITIPDGFVRDAQLVRNSRDFLHAFRKPGPDGVDTVIIIERMGGQLKREKFDMKDMPPGIDGRLLTLRWQEFEIDGFEMREDVNGVGINTYKAQLPLKSSAIQISVVGKREDAAQLQATLNALLATLDGESNWLKSASPSAVADSPIYPILLVILMVLIIGGGLVLLWFVRRRSRRGAVLLVALLIYVLSFRFPEMRLREMRALEGSLRMLGFLGLLFGIVDLFWHPARKPPRLPQTADRSASPTT